jgi:hypothetical protein
MTSLTLIVIAFAVYRATHLIVFDRIVDPVRNLFVKRFPQKTEHGWMMRYTLQGGPIRRFIGKIVNCPMCTGLWVSIAFVILIKVFPNTYVWYGFIILAVAGIASLLGIITMKLMGITEMMEVKNNESEVRNDH